ncbi:hypothetical protein C8J57DRAFT_1557901 [Mycena rebaudengoi]|nr:hypothetical protein C8J57DRAFT_1557901 [Mycena rebaudengoi]
MCLLSNECTKDAQAARRPCRVVPAAPLPDPSAHAYRPQQQSQSQQPQYGCIGGGGYAGRWGVQSARTSPVRVGGWSPPSARRTWRSSTRQQHTPAHQQQHTPHQQHMPQHTPHQHQQHAAPPRARTTTQWTPQRPAYAAAVHGQWTPPRLPRFTDLEWWSPGVGEVVPSHAPQVPSHAPQVPSHALAPPAHTHVPSHTLPQLAPLAQAPMPRHAVFANAGLPGVGYSAALRSTRGLPRCSTVPPSSSSTDTDMH